jgi:predicted NUDIX family NTP pyrophosphohydrolase
MPTAWSIATGEYQAPEPGLRAALREFREQTGFDLSGLRALAPVQLKSGKVVEARATPADTCSASGPLQLSG